MNIYNRYNAVQYARKWALNRNPDFPIYDDEIGEGGDCTNFVSQAMLAGGWSISWGTNTDSRTWWSDQNQSSRAWSVCQRFRYFIEISRRAAPCRRDEIIWGDLVFVVLNGRATHVMIVTGAQERQSADRRDANPIKEIFYCGHTINRLDQRLSGGTGGTEYFEYWKVANTFPDAPQPGHSFHSIPDTLRRNI